MVDFAGWEMPLLYTGIVEEHHYTRSVASFFDVSHMGRIELRGNDAEAVLERICTRKLGDAQVGQSRYSHVCNESAGILDDVIVSRYEDKWLVVCNASNRTKILDWIRRHAESRKVRIDDITESTVMVALQGPTVLGKLTEKLPMPVGTIKRYRFLSGSYMFVPYTVFRSGYTGEDGVELIVPATVGRMIGGLLASAGDEDGEGPRPAGLGARDTLRLEAGMPLYGHELHEQIDTISAGLGWAADLTKDFIGADALRRIEKEGPKRKLVGLELEGRRIGRQHAAVLHDGATVGEVTSGTFAPTLQRSIAMAYVDANVSETGQSLSVDLGGGRCVEAVVAALPFYSRTR